MAAGLREPDALTGCVGGRKQVAGRLGRSGQITGCLKETQVSGKITGGHVAVGTIRRCDGLTGRIRNFTGASEVYGGPYTVIPETVEQELATTGKKMTDDVLVKEIPYFSVSNDKGGNTVIIGGTGS